MLIGVPSKGASRSPRPTTLAGNGVANIDTRDGYRFVLEGDTIVAMSPRGIYAPMFAPLDD